jgi:hypothetical protein
MLTNLERPALTIETNRQGHSVHYLDGIAVGISMAAANWERERMCASILHAAKNIVWC